MPLQEAALPDSDTAQHHSHRPAASCSRMIESPCPLARTNDWLACVPESGRRRLGVGKPPLVSTRSQLLCFGYDWGLSVRAPGFCPRCCLLPRPARGVSVLHGAASLRGRAKESDKQPDVSKAANGVPTCRHPQGLEIKCPNDDFSVTWTSSCEDVGMYTAENLVERTSPF